MVISIKEWIIQNLVISTGLYAKKCRKEWFSFSGNINKYNEILSLTLFLDDINPTIPQRIWHIFNNEGKVFCDSCKINVPRFKSFKKGYFNYCSNKCAQVNELTKNKVIATNINKYGYSCTLNSPVIKEKAKETLLIKYGGSNSKELQNKKMETFNKNHNKDWFLGCDDGIKKEPIEKKCVVRNVQYLLSVKEKAILTKKSNFYEYLFGLNKLDDRISPLFSKNEYISGGIDQKYLFKCKKCNDNFNDFLKEGDSPRCPKCYGNLTLFKEEILEYIKNIIPQNVQIIEKDIKELNEKELDIYIPSKKVAIICADLYNHGELNGKKSKNYHLNMTLDCEKKDIHLIHILEDEWIFNSKIVKSRLNHILGVDPREKIFARKCKIMNIDHKLCYNFLLNQHVQGDDKSQIKLGAFYNDQLVAIMTFGRLRTCMGNKVNVKGEYEMYRFCTSQNVIGIASKLLAHFIKNYNPIRIISFADRRWSKAHGNLYETLGFKFIAQTQPNYWYFGKNGKYKRLHRYNYRKSELQSKLEIFDPNKTEWENMVINGYDRLWDCGSLKYEMIFNKKDGNNIK